MVISLISLAYVEEDGLLLSAAFVAGIVLIGIGKQRGPYQRAVVTRSTGRRGYVIGH